MDHIPEKKQPKFHKKHLFWLIPSIFVFIVFILFLLSPIFVKSYIKKKITSVEKIYQIDIKYDDFTFKKYEKLHFDNLMVTTQPFYDTLFLVNSVDVELGYDKGLLKPYPADLQIDQLFVKANEKQVMETTPQEEENVLDEALLATKLDKILRAFHHYLPQKFNANRITIAFSEEDCCEYQVENLHIVGELLSGELRQSEKGNITPWHLSGNISTDRSKIDGILSYEGDKEKQSPNYFCQKKWNMDISFAELHFSYHLLDEKPAGLSFTVKAEMEDVAFFHPIAVEQKIALDDMILDCSVRISPNRIYIDSTSTLSLNGLEVPFLLIFEEHSNKWLKFQIFDTQFEYRDFVAMMPSGLFRVLPKLEIDGKVDFSLLFDCDFSVPENLIFDFNLSSRKLAFTDSTREFFMRYNRDFHYEYKEEGTVVRDIWISPAQDDFVAYDQIPFYLKYAILAAEDPAFFRHAGFLKSSMKESIVTNLERGRLSRGGSTLSMQLVKNLFLTKKKTFSRKIEELFLVWLIEDNKLISKERMFEIYVNIIEWGPQVYGLGEASRFYFDKSPDRLSFGECVFLATLIRSPKQYARALDADGYPTNERREEMHLIARRMLDRGLINQTQYDTFNSYVETKTREGAE
ncbi:transglycosylase domain-containing protein [Bacteroidales bacterium OttesenSCG-928-B11]|nr:transglycosylase domain-containing protein [Bacteroidales bacterium OttesenSCG-928-C03]MDL2311943.1 transglycosylase domain-containing protein [Bacteroidales bacterium OttesenSCG-928-B11]